MPRFYQLLFRCYLGKLVEAGLVIAEPLLGCGATGVGSKFAGTVEVEGTPGIELFGCVVV